MIGTATVLVLQADSGVLIPYQYLPETGWEAREAGMPRGTRGGAGIATPRSKFQRVLGGWDGLGCVRDGIASFQNSTA
jgi:hypothetical protein